MIVLCIAALSVMAKGPRWFERPATPVTLQSSVFEIRTMLPHGWSYTAAAGFAPPADVVPPCRVRVVLHTNRKWDAMLVPALRATEGARTSEDDRFAMKVGGHPAVSNRYVRGPHILRDIYIDLSGLQPDSAAVWTFEGDRSAAGSDCELQFLSIVRSGRIELADGN